VVFLDDRADDSLGYAVNLDGEDGSAWGIAPLSG
jgi:hypothetical protein